VATIQVIKPSRTVEMLVLNARVGAHAMAIRAAGSSSIARIRAAGRRAEKLNRDRGLA
jgi:hypothetical protein